MYFNNYYYRQSNQWKVLPEWARFFLKLGATLGGHQITSHRFVVGIALPTKAYAASLLTAGLIASLSKIPTSDEDITAHFQRLCALEPETPLVYTKNNKRFKAFFDGVEEVLGSKRIRLRVQSSKGKKAKNRTELLDAKRTQQVEVANTTFRRLPQNQSGRGMSVDNPDFIRAFLQIEEINDFTTKSCFDCLIIGQVNRFKQEIDETLFAVKPKKQKLVEGHLQDILRVRRFSGSSSNYRSDIYAARSELENLVSPKFVIFDDANGYLKWRDTWHQSHWIVLLDRTSARFEDATSQFNQEFFKYRYEEGKLAQMPAIPSGVEIVIRYQERNS